MVTIITRLYRNRTGLRRQYGNNLFETTSEKLWQTSIRTVELWFVVIGVHVSYESCETLIIQIFI